MAPGFLKMGGRDNPSDIFASMDQRDVLPLNKDESMRTLIMMVALAFFGCSSDGDGPRGQVDFSLVGKGALHGNGAEGIDASHQVISDPAAWEQLMDKMDSVNDESGGFERTGFDFSTHQLLAVFDQIRSSGGHVIEIARILENDAALVVEVVTDPGSGEITQIMTQPYHIVSIPKTDRPIVFE